MSQRTHSPARCNTTAKYDGSPTCHFKFSDLPLSKNRSPLCQSRDTLENCKSAFHHMDEDQWNRSEQRRDKLKKHNERFRTQHKNQKPRNHDDHNNNDFNRSRLLPNSKNVSSPNHSPLLHNYLSPLVKRSMIESKEFSRSHATDESMKSNEQSKLFEMHENQLHPADLDMPHAAKSDLLEIDNHSHLFNKVVKQHEFRDNDISKRLGIAGQSSTPKCVKNRKGKLQFERTELLLDSSCLSSDKHLFSGSDIDSDGDSSVLDADFDLLESGIFDSKSSPKLVQNREQSSQSNKAQDCKDDNHLIRTGNNKDEECKASRKRALPDPVCSTPRSYISTSLDYSYLSEILENSAVCPKSLPEFGKAVRSRSAANCKEVKTTSAIDIPSGNVHAAKSRCTVKTETANNYISLRDPVVINSPVMRKHVKCEENGAVFCQTTSCADAHCSLPKYNSVSKRGTSDGQFGMNRPTVNVDGVELNGVNNQKSDIASDSATGFHDQIQRDGSAADVVFVQTFANAKTADSVAGQRRLQAGKRRKTDACNLAQSTCIRPHIKLERHTLEQHDKESSTSAVTSVSQQNILKNPRSFSTDSVNTTTDASASQACTSSQKPSAKRSKICKRKVPQRFLQPEANISGRESSNKYSRNSADLSDSATLFHTSTSDTDLTCAASTKDTFADDEDMVLKKLLEEQKLQLLRLQQKKVASVRSMSSGSHFIRTESRPKTEKKPTSEPLSWRQQQQQDNADSAGENIVIEKSSSKNATGGKSVISNAQGHASLISVLQKNTEEGNENNKDDQSVFPVGSRLCLANAGASSDKLDDALEEMMEIDVSVSPSPKKLHQISPPTRDSRNESDVECDWLSVYAPEEDVVSLYSYAKRPPKDAAAVAELADEATDQEYFAEPEKTITSPSSDEKPGQSEAEKTNSHEAAGDESSLKLKVVSSFATESKYKSLSLVTALLDYGTVSQVKMAAETFLQVFRDSESQTQHLDVEDVAKRLGQSLLESNQGAYLIKLLELSTELRIQHSLDVVEKAFDLSTVESMQAAKLFKQLEDASLLPEDMALKIKSKLCLRSLSTCRRVDVVDSASSAPSQNDESKSNLMVEIKQKVEIWKTGQEPVAGTDRLVTLTESHSPSRPRLRFRVPRGTISPPRGLASRGLTDAGGQAIGQYSTRLQPKCDLREKLTEKRFVTLESSSFAQDGDAIRNCRPFPTRSVFIDGSLGKQRDVNSPARSDVQNVERSVEYRPNVRAPGPHERIGRHGFMPVKPASTPYAKHAPYASEQRPLGSEARALQPGSSGSILPRANESLSKNTPETKSLSVHVSPVDNGRKVTTTKKVAAKDPWKDVALRNAWSRLGRNFGDFLPNVRNLQMENDLIISFLDLLTSSEARNCDIFKDFVASAKQHVKKMRPEKSLILDKFLSRMALSLIHERDVNFAYEVVTLIRRQNLNCTSVSPAGKEQISKCATGMRIIHVCMHKEDAVAAAQWAYEFFVDSGACVVGPLQGQTLSELLEAAARKCLLHRLHGHALKCIQAIPIGHSKGTEVSILEQVLKDVLRLSVSDVTCQWLNTVAELMLCRNLLNRLRRILNDSRFNEMSLQLFKYLEKKGIFHCPRIAQRPHMIFVPYTMGRIEMTLTLYRHLTELSLFLIEIKKRLRRDIPLKIVLLRDAGCLLPLYLDSRNRCKDALACLLESVRTLIVPALHVRSEERNRRTGETMINIDMSSVLDWLLQNTSYAKIE